MDIIITATGDLRFIHNDDLTDLLGHGNARITRASMVEPVTVAGGGVQWSADMEPSDGPVLGPYRTRGEALAAEVAWLKENRGL